MLRGDIINVALHRYVYREVTAMIDAKPALKVPRPSTAGCGLLT